MRTHQPASASAYAPAVRIGDRPATLPGRIRWAYGVTTVPARKADLLPATLESLAAAGFDRPRLFVDGTRDGREWERTFGLEVTTRWPAAKAVGNWILSAWELYVRERGAERFAIFQDDLVTYKNLRGYLERVPYPERAYLNLYSFRDNEAVIRGQPTGFHEAALLGDGAVYHGKKQQCGRGAVALVFSRDALAALFSSAVFVAKPQAATRSEIRLDGCIVEAMNQLGWREFIHNPSLVQHAGDVSTIRGVEAPPHRHALSFRRDSFDALELLEGR